MRSFSSTLLVATLTIGLAGAAFADTYSSGSTSVITTGPRVAAPTAMAPMGNPNVLNDPQSIRSCLCLQSQYQNQSTVVAGKQAAYNQAVSQKSGFDSMVASAHTGTAPNLDQVRQASENSIILQNNINQTYLPDLQNATAMYNQSVESYQQSCGSKSFNADVMAQVKTNLSCQ